MENIDLEHEEYMKDPVYAKVYNDLCAAIEVCLKLSE